MDPTKDPIGSNFGFLYMLVMHAASDILEEIVGRVADNSRRLGVKGETLNHLTRRSSERDSQEAKTNAAMPTALRSSSSFANLASLPGTCHTRSTQPQAASNAG